VLSVRGLGYQPRGAGQRLRDISFDVAAGQIVGLAGVEGNGQTELAEILTGLRHTTAGSVRVDGAEIATLDVAGHRAAGIAYVPEDRHFNGAALSESLADNLIVDRYTRAPVGRRGLLRPRAIRANAERLVGEYAIRAPHPSVPVESLSGGNLQKVVVARELSSAPRLLVAAQLTRGIDVGAMRFIYDRLIAARDGGAAVCLVSADLTELLSLADRLLVIKDGELVARFDDVAGLTEMEVGRFMLGVDRHPSEMVAS
jgi:simple sugar transport system ATP-binding protein